MPPEPSIQLTRTDSLRVRLKYPSTDLEEALLHPSHCGFGEHLRCGELLLFMLDHRTKSAIVAPLYKVFLRLLIPPRVGMCSPADNRGSNVHGVPRHSEFRLEGLSVRWVISTPT